MKKYQTMSILSVFIFAVFWEIASHNAWIDKSLFPQLSAILSRLAELLSDHVFLSRDLGGSGRRLLLAILIFAPAAIALGAVSGASLKLNALISPFVNFALPLPKVALFPLILVIFGIGDAGKIFLIGLGIFFHLYINTFAGMVRLQASPLMDLVKIYEIKSLNLFFRFYALGILTDILVGLKSALGYALTLVVVSEFSISNNGLGQFIWRAWDQFRVIDMYAGIFILGVIGWASQSLLDIIIRWRIRRN
jgi:ABC-type nitrate/sulfonate/bicarbonate transport system permease component